MKPTSIVGGTGAFCDTCVRSEKVKWVAVHGSAMQHLFRTVTASVRTDCQAAWRRTRMRLCELYSPAPLRTPIRGSPPLAPAYRLSTVWRIVRLCEPAHRFIYAKNQMYRWWDGLQN